MKKLILIYFGILLCINLAAQSSAPILQEWLTFENVAGSKARSTQNKKSLLGLRPNDELKVIASNTDKTGKTHSRNQQEYHGIPVEGAIIMTHEQNNLIQSANGHLVRNLSLNTQPNISKETALNLALNHINAKKYAWEFKEMEQTLKEATEDPNATFLPQAELVIFSPDFSAAKARLAYSLEIYALQPHHKVRLLIDAQTANILQEMDLMHHGDVPGSGETAFYGTRNITCHYNPYNGGYFLEETENRKIETRNGTPQIPSPPYHPWNFYHLLYNPRGIPIENDSSFWNDEDPIALGVHWAAEKWYDYMDSTFNWTSYNGKGRKIINVTHAHYIWGDDINGAFWNGHWASYGDGNGTSHNSWTSIDMVAHELTHGLIEHTADLIYYGESGALNESFADIFAAVVEYYALGYSEDIWKIGEKITVDSSGLRDMSVSMQYKGNDGWHYGWSDHGGVHTNNAVQNHWFYLLSQEIGIENAAAICFHSLKNYLTPHSNYQDARNASLMAAEELFGTTAQTAVCNAWNAVGVFGGSCGENETISIIAPSTSETLIINNPIDIEWTNSDNISHVNIEYLIDGDSVWHSIANYLEASINNIHTWSIPELEINSNISIRISNAANYGTKDSLGLFNVENCPAIAEFLADSLHTCIGNSLYFRDTSLNASSHEWFLNGSLMSINTDFTWTTDIVGMSELELRAYDASGCYGSYAQKVYVADSTNAAAGFSYQIQGSNILFSADIENPYAEYSWDFGDGDVGSTSKVSHAYDRDSLYTVCLLVDGDCGRFEYCEKVTVLSSSGSGEFCDNDWTQYTNGDHINATLEVGDYIWVGTNGGLVKLSKLDGSTVFFNNYNSGLPDNDIYSLLEDTAGNIWIGTDYGGLAKYNGTSWEIYNSSNSGLPSNRITSLLEDTAGNIWIGTYYDGLAKYNGTSWEIYNSSNSSLPHNRISSLLEDTAGNIWIGTYAGGLAKYNGTSWEIYNSSNSGLPHNRISSLLEDTAGNIWIGTYAGGLAKYNGTSWEIYNSSNSGLPSNIIRSLLEDTAGNIWIGTSYNGLTKYNGTSWEIYNSSNSGLPHDLILSLLEDTAGNIWIGTYGGGLAKYNGTSWEIYNSSNSGLPHDLILSLLEDTAGNIWVGTDYGGLAKYNGTSWEIYNSSNPGLPHDLILSLLEDTAGNIWIGTGGGLAKYNGTSWEVFNISNSGLTYNSIRSLLEDTAGNIWIGTDGGLAKYNGTSWEIYNSSNSGLPYNSIRSLLEDTAGNIWVVTEADELAKYNGTSWEIYNSSNSGLPNNSIFSLLEDTAGNIWIGTDDGLAKYNGTSWEVFNISNSGLPSNWIPSLLEDTAGNIWIGTYGGGLAKYNGTDWEIYNSSNSGLPNNRVSSLLEDMAGNIWIGTYGGGLAKYNGTSWEIYNSSNSGLPDNWVYSLLEDTAGNIWIGTDGGIGILHPSINFQTTITCSQDTTHFQNKSHNPSQSEWKINGITVSHETNLSYLFEESENYEITLIVTNDNGCTDVYRETISIPASAQELEEHLPEYLSICDSDSASIDMSTHHYVSYEWTDSLGTVLDSTALFITDNTGLYYLTVIDSCGASAMDSVIVVLGSDCVWAGDTNKDGIVNHLDVLAIGMNYDANGESRLGAMMDWLGQACLSWNGTYGGNEIDIKHVDADGNGTINDVDIEAILLNYGKEREETFPLTLPPAINAPYSLIPVFEGINPNTNDIQLSLKIRSNDGTYEDFYGMAARIAYDSPSGMSTLERPLSLQYDAVGSDVISVHRQFTWHTDFAFVGTNHQNRNFGANPGGAAAGPDKSMVVYAIGEERELAGGDSLPYLRILPQEILMINYAGDTILVKGEQLDVYLPEADFSFAMTSRPITCDSIGSATVHPTDLTKTYTYLWSTGDTTQTILFPIAGIYSVTVTDSDGITAEGTIDIEGMEEPEIVIEENNGILTANVSNGAGNYLYHWTTGETTASISVPDDVDMEVSVTVIDGNACLAEASHIKHIYVDDTATGANDGTSWTDAFTDLQDALAIGADARIHIAEGIYYPTMDNQRDISFDIPNNCEIYGNYPDGGGVANDTIYETILSGDIDQDGSSLNNSYHVVTAKGMDTTIQVLMNGLTIRDGNADDMSSFGRARGGGIFINNALVELNHIIVESNEAVYGGGIFATLSDYVSVDESTFKGNTSYYGSAIYHSNETNFYINKTRIVNNNSLVRAAVEMNNSLFTKIEHTVIANNASRNANAISFISTNRNGSAEIINSTILGETKDKVLVTMQIGRGDQLDLSVNNSIIAHQNIDFDKAFKSYNNGILNLVTNHCYIQGSSVMGTATNNLYSAIDGALILDDDYALLSCSPGEDAGSNTFVTDSADINGNPRIINGTVDMGAYEIMIPCGNARYGLEGDTSYKEKDIRVFPNPSQGKLLIETDLENVNFQLQDILGKVILTTNSKELDISHLPDGVYILKVMQDEILVNSIKVVKE